jgi:hypothetical protein
MTVDDLLMLMPESSKLMSLRRREFDLTSAGRQNITAALRDVAQRNEFDSYPRGDK